MALIKCPECGKEISDKAEHCIHCGFPIGQQVKPAIETRAPNTNVGSTSHAGHRVLKDNEVFVEYSNRDKTWRCPTCGKELAKNALFCPNCGRRYPHLSKLIPIVIIACIFVAGLIIAMSFR